MQGDGMTSFPEHGRADSDDAAFFGPITATREHAPFPIAADDLEPPPTAHAPLRYLRWAALGIAAVVVVALGIAPVSRLFTEEEVEDIEPPQDVVSLESPPAAPPPIDVPSPASATAPSLDVQFPATVSARYPEAVDPAKLISPVTIRTADAPGKNYVVILERDSRNVPFVVLYMSPGQSVDLGVEPGRRVARARAGVAGATVARAGVAALVRIAAAVAAARAAVAAVARAGVAGFVRIAGAVAAGR